MKILWLVWGILIAAIGMGPKAPVVVISRSVMLEMDSLWVDGNRHWDELQNVATLSQLLGAVPTQREFFGCLAGMRSGDTVYVTRTVPATHVRRLQVAVSGTCVMTLLGTWHTHPYIADPKSNLPHKSRVLSEQDLMQFEKGNDDVTIVVWDVDSVDVAVRDSTGTIRHPAGVIVR